MVEVVINHRSADGLILRNVTMEVLNNLTGLQVCAAIVCRPGPTSTKIYVLLKTEITPMHPIPTPPTMIPSPSTHQSLVQFKSKVISALALEGGFQHFLMTLDGQAFGSRVPLFAHTSFAAGCVIDIGTTHTTCDTRPYVRDACARTDVPTPPTRPSHPALVWTTPHRGHWGPPKGIGPHVNCQRYTRRALWGGCSPLHMTPCSLHIKNSWQRATALYFR